MSALPGPALLTVGRINLDLFATPGVTGIRAAQSFAPSVGGSPTNTAIAARRLGVRSAVLTAVGQDEVGDLVHARLEATGVDVRWVHRVAGHRTSMAFLATLSADVGERVFYRNGAADTCLDAEVLATLPWESLQVVLLSLDSLASGSTADVVRLVAQHARQHGVPVWWDLDLRPDSWTGSPQYAGVGVPAVREADLLIGTEEEFSALLGIDGPPGDVDDRVRELGAPVTVLKRGPRGATLIRPGHADVDVAAVATQPVCTVGGGDSATGALVAARLGGCSWDEALQVAMLAAGHTVGRPGCSEGFPTAHDLGLADVTAGTLARSLTPRPPGEYVRPE
ncbi:MAG: carbohydrate kinase family protein [Angustibacter sp.]